ncbi:MAG: roadblock/LC7 domain-containing protein [Gammaproteobacteria bacterium]|nr:roadblock/LC7 domain-containing protein [Gammaproteobacteria bacterium]
MADISQLKDLDGFVGGCLVDSDTGLILGKEGEDNFDLNTAAAGNTEVVKAKRKTMKALGIPGGIEDILITLDSQYHLIRLLKSNSAIFLYVVIDKAKGSLGMARAIAKKVEESLDLSKLK